MSTERNAEMQALELQLKQAIKERDELAAWKEDAMRELTALQQVTHQLAHNGSMCWDYSRDARAVMEREPATSLSHRDARMKAEALEGIVSKPIWSTVYAAQASAREIAEHYRKQAEDAQ